DRQRVAPGNDGAEAAVAEYHAHQIWRQQRGMVAGGEFHRRDDGNSMLLLERLPNPGQRFDRTAFARRRVPEVLVATLDGCPVAEAHPEDRLLALRKDREHPMRLAVGADDRRSRLNFAHPDEPGWRQ